jgi:tetratricopeptide (TPR) repeat protein
VSATTGDTSREIATALSRLADAPFFGRGALLASFEIALERALAGDGGALLLSGEPGIGKTRCAAELVARARGRGFGVLEARCHEAEGAPALWPWAEVTRKLAALRGVAELRRYAGANAPLLGGFVAELAEPGSARGAEPRPDDDAQYRLFEATARTFEQASRAAPLLVVLDDLHWADPASVRLARFAVRELRGAPLLFLLLHRSAEPRPGTPLAVALAELSRETESHALAGLGPDEVDAWVAHVTGAGSGSPLARALSSRTGGNPLFLKETLRVLVTDGRLGAGEEGAVPLPRSVRHTLERRLEALSGGSLRVARQAAVLGATFEVSLLLRACEAQDLDAEKFLDEALGLGIVHPVEGASGAFRFAHDLLRDTALASATLAERAGFHRRAAEAIVAVRAPNLEPHFAELARHYLACATPDTASDAARFSLRAADAASRSFSFEVAIELYEAALQAVELLRADSRTNEQVLRTQCVALVELGHALWQVGRRREARQRCELAVSLAQRLSDATLFARAAIGLAGRHDLPMDFPDASVRLMEEALARLPVADSSLRAHLLASLVRAKYYGEDRAQLVAWARESAEIAERLEDPSAAFAALEALHYARMLPEELEERLAISSRLEELAQRWGSPRAEALAQIWRAVDLMEAGDMEGADAALSRLARAAESVRQPFHRWLAVALRATHTHALGRLDVAEQLTFEALRIGQEADSPNAVLFFGTQLFHLRREQGRVDELLPLMQRIVDERPALPVFRIGIPLIHALSGRLDEARAAFEPIAARDFADVPHDIHRAPLLSSAALVAARLGDTRRAARLLDALRPLAGHVLLAGVGTYWSGAADFVLGLLEETLGRYDAAVLRFEQAAAIARRAGARLHEAHALAALGRVLPRRGTGADRARALAARSEAERIYRAAGVTWHLGSGAAADAQDTQAPVPAPANAFLRVRDRWLISFAGASIELPASKGLDYLRSLIAARDRELHVMELVSEGGAGGAGVREESLDVQRGAAGLELLDARARRAYRERLRELEAAREDAEARGDLGRLEALAAEREAIESELDAALGAGGRGRRAAGGVERARKAVYNRLRDAIARIGEQHPELARHLERSVHTGTTCAYRPDHDPAWRL